jgi:PKD repeat protein
MKKKLLFPLLVFLPFLSGAQVICILCFDQNDSISQNVNNLLLNGGFENGCGTGGYYCPSSSGYSCNLTDWLCTGGGANTYAQVIDGSYNSYVVEGTYAAYFGNAFCNICSSAQSDTSCLSDSGCTATGIPAGYPYNSAGYGGVNGVTIEQTVNGLTPGNTYVLEFWAGGEASQFSFRSLGMFAVDVGFGNILLRDKPTAPATTDIGTTFIIEFNAVSTSHTIKFINWGHICNDCTELVIDNARLYTLAELSPSVPSCNPFPTAIFSAPNHICPGTCTDFINLSTNGNSYIWTFQGANPGTSTDMSPTNICYGTPGAYGVTLVATNGNGADTLFLPNYITVYPFPAPQGISQIGDTLFANAGAVSYQWYYNGNAVSGATNYYYVADQSGDYNVVATDANGCEVEAVIFGVLVDVASVDGKKTLRVFPNPAGESLNVIGNLLIGTAVEISVYNIVGEKIYSGIVKDASARSPIVVDCRDFSPGLYHVELAQSAGAGEIFRAKFVKQ